MGFKVQKNLILFVSAALLVNLLKPALGSQGISLAPLVRQGEHEAVVENLGFGSLPDKPDDAGDTALFAAAEAGDHATAEVLLQYHSDASMPAPATGQTPFVAAAQRLDAKMIALFLKYGNSPDAADAHGETPRKVIRGKEASLERTQEILELFRRFDRGGAEEFEDPPGTWLRASASEYQEMSFYHNTETSASTYLPPTSCSWSRVGSGDGSGGPAYVNALTRQTKWTRPKALNWRWVLGEQASHGREGFWHNPSTGKSMWEVPGELPPEMLEEIRAQNFWYNTVTGETTWEDPLETGWRQLSDPHGVYWFHPVREESTRSPPEELSGWQRVWSEEHGRPFYHNTLSSETTWDPPAHFAWVRYSAATAPGTLGGTAAELEEPEEPEEPSEEQEHDEL